MKTKNKLSTATLLVLATLALTISPSIYAVGSRSTSPSKVLASARIEPADSDKTPSVRVYLQIPQTTGDQAIDIFAYDHQTFREAAYSGGGADGKLQVGPVTVSKRIDCYTPTLHQIHSTGLHLKEVKLRWARFDPDTNTEYLFFTIKLTDVVISAIHTWLPNQHDTALVKLGEIEEVSFVYKKMEMDCGGV
jgi:type VI secretion system Hcp family effector